MQKTAHVEDLKVGNACIAVMQVERRALTPDLNLNERTKSQYGLPKHTVGVNEENPKRNPDFG